MDELKHIQERLNIKSVTPIAGDASGRRYFRTERGILMCDQSENAQEVMGRFLDVSNRLAMGKIPAPEILAIDLEAGFLLLEDLGNLPLRAAANAENYKKAGALIGHLQALPADGLKRYDESVYLEEISRICRFYLAPLGEANCDIVSISEPEIAQLAAHERVFTHVDFMAENLMTKGETLAVIDFQDARAGHPLYDLASLIDDVRIHVAPAWRQAAIDGLLGRELTQQEERDLATLSAQRLIKIMGIFARLTIEGKTKYAALMPRVYELASARLEATHLRSWQEWWRAYVPAPSPDILAKLKGAQNAD